jgi:hypothetical protein
MKQFANFVFVLVVSIMVSKAGNKIIYSQSPEQDGVVGIE